MSCRACKHPSRDQIDRDITDGKPLRAIVAYSGLSLGGLVRHKDHIRDLLKDAMRTRASESAEHADDLVLRIERVVTAAEEILTAAKSEKSFGPATQALNSVLRALELIARLRGDLQPQNT